MLREPRRSSERGAAKPHGGALAARLGAGALIAAALAQLASCNEIAGIRPVRICLTDADCGVEPGCGECSQGACIFVPEGTPAPGQAAGDCQVRQCDGRGGVRDAVPDADDVPVDANPCTAKSCLEGIALYTPLDAAVDCYEGPDEVAGVGACAMGERRCLDGALSQACIGSVLPQPEVCGLDQGDLDCDGVALEGSGDGCCGDGQMDPMEECDDGNQDENDGCSSTCRIQEVLELVTGGNHTCALLTGGLVKCWGTNNSGQLAKDDSIASIGITPESMGENLVPVDLGGESALAMVSGSAHVCVLLAGGVKCWGNNSSGQLGTGKDIATANQPADLDHVSLGTGAKVARIAGGGNQSCAILEGGTLKCWGNNAEGQLGLGNNQSRGTSPADMGDSLPAVYLGVGAQVQAVACGVFHTCALLQDGTVKCWGRNVEGQLGVHLDTPADARGDAPGEMEALPAVPLASKATAITAGRYHSCALLDDGRVQCWGRNADGELGQGNETSTATAMAIAPPLDAGSNGKKAIAVSAGGRLVNNAQMISYSHTCAMLEDRSIKCWGNNAVGQLGRANKATYGKLAGQTITALNAIPLSQDKQVKTISAGGRHTCALFEGGSVRCWGENMNGQLGQGKPGTEHYSDEAGEQVDLLPTVNLFGPPLP